MQINFEHRLRSSHLCHCQEEQGYRKQVSVLSIKSMRWNVRRSSESTSLRFCANGIEGIRNHGNKKVDNPKIEDNDGHDKVEAGNKKIRVNHGIHER